MNDPTFTFGNIGLPLIILAAVAGILPWVMVPRETRSQRRVTGIVVMIAVFMLILSAAVMSFFDKRVVEAGTGLPEQGMVAWLYIKSALPAVMAWGPVLLLVWLGLAQRVERRRGEDMARQNDKALAFLVATFFGFSPEFVSAEDKTDYNQFGRKAYAVWDCAAYATLFEEDKEVGEQLFITGYEMHLEMVGLLLESKLDEEDVEEWPVAYRWYILGGPTTEFAVGFIWAQFSSKAYDETWNSELTAPFDELKELQRGKAKNEFRRKNCGLLLK